MKKLVLYTVLTLLTGFVYGQKSFVHSDSVDSLMFKYLNMYRASNGLKPVRLDSTFKASCVSWAKRTSDSVVNGRVNLKHTKTRGRYSEVICGGGVQSLNDQTKKYYKFVERVTTKNPMMLSDVDNMVLVLLFAWDQSEPHKKILNDPNQTKGYSALYYKPVGKMFPKGGVYLMVDAPSVIQLGY